MASTRPGTLKTETLAMDDFFDFNQGTTQPSPATASSSKNDAFSPFDQTEERQRFNGPSHDYNQYKQQVGLPSGSLSTVPQSGMFDGYNSGIGDMGFESMNGWASGIDIESDMTMDFNTSQNTMPAMFFPPQNHNTQADSFVDPNSIGGDQAPSNVGRLWPGMHSQQAQQAAMQKQAQAHANQQRQMKMQAQHAHYRQVASGSQSQASSQQSHGNGKRASYVSEPHVEESISRLLSQMRQNSAVSAGDEDGDGNMLPHIARMKKDEEEMDEDERLLNSEEGKKLSSKERRQLRNKVSARAFRSRRKEYISQLEGEVAVKVQEANNLRGENQLLHQENDRYRALIETLLRHPAFTPFINDISKDPSVLGALQQHPQQQQHQQSVTPTPQHVQPQVPSQPSQQDAKPDFMNFDASQLQIPQQQPQQSAQQQPQRERVGMAMIPENDFSKLNINGFQNFNNFHNVNAYAVTDLPSGPDPVDLLIDSPARLPRSHSAATTMQYSAAAPTPASDFSILLAKLDGAARNIGSTKVC